MSSRSNVEETALRADAPAPRRRRGPARGVGPDVGSGLLEVLSLDDGRMQFLVREPFGLQGPAAKLLHRSLPADEPLRVTSKMREGRLFLDGSHHRVPFPVGSVLEAAPSAPPLHIVVTDQMRERRRALMQSKRSPAQSS